MRGNAAYLKFEMSNEKQIPSTDRCEFFLVTLPGLEKLAVHELNNWAAHLESEITEGGVTVFAPLSEGLELNRVLKMPTRILLRVAKFGCRDFPKLFKKVRGTDWSLWLKPGVDLSFKASSHRSRLYIKKRIEKTCSEAFGERTQTTDKESVVDALVRIVDDICTISLNTSGEILHKRGDRPLSSPAPLRETTAAAMLWLLETNEKESAPTNGVELVDPMMGAGTFFIEAMGLKKPVQGREFAYENWFNLPLSEGRERHLFASQTENVYTSFVGFERDAKTLLAAEANLHALGWGAKSSSLIPDGPRETALHNEDFFSAERLPRPRNSRWLIANPPYGERIKVSGPLHLFYENLFLTCERVAQPERAIFLLSAKVSIQRLKFPREWMLAAHQKLSNGGLAVHAVKFFRVKGA